MRFAQELQRVLREDVLTQRAEALARRLDDRRVFGLAPNFTLPALGRYDGGRAVHAGREASGDGRVGDAIRAALAATGAEDQNCAEHVF
ncbi:MAG: hypothetical protein ABI846_10375 [Rudaea sp.]